MRPLLPLLPSTLLLAAALGCGESPRPGASPERAPLPSTSAASAPSTSASAGGPAPSASATAATRPSRPLNVIFFTVDAMRADVPWLGYSRPTMPFVTELASKSVVYEQFRSNASYTAQSISVMLSGRYTSTLYRRGVFFTKYSDGNVFFPEVLQAKGVRTIGVQAHKYFERSSGFEQGFDVWDITPGIAFDAETDNFVTSDKTHDLLVKHLSDPANVGGQFFVYAHWMDPHDQYVRHEGCPAEWGKSNRDRYDCELWHVDAHMKRFFDWAATQPWWSNTAIVISSDHGEEFFEHEMWKHAFRVWDTLVHIPYVVYVPGIEPRRISEPRTHIDTAQTILDLMGVPAPDGMMGQSLVPELYGAPPEKRVSVIELNADSNNPYWRAIVWDGWKLMVEGKGRGHTRKLFHLAVDPGETKDLADTEKAKLEEMLALFEKTFAEIPSIKPWGGTKLSTGDLATGPTGPAKE